MASCNHRTLPNFKLTCIVMLAADCPSSACLPAFQASGRHCRQQHFKCLLFNCGVRCRITAPPSWDSGWASTVLVHDHASPLLPSRVLDICGHIYAGAKQQGARRACVCGRARAFECGCVWRGGWVSRWESARHTLDSEVCTRPLPTRSAAGLQQVCSITSMCNSLAVASRSRSCTGRPTMLSWVTAFLCASVLWGSMCILESTDRLR